MSYYIEKIEEFSTTISGHVKAAMLEISESFDTNTLAENFSISNSIVTEGTQSTIDTINNLSDQVSTSTVVVSPEVNQTIIAETTAIRDIHERTIYMVEEIVEKFEKEQTEVKVEFNLEDPDERIEHVRCVKALDMACALSDIKSIFRNKLKYGDLSDVLYNYTDKMLEEFFDILDGHGINLDELLR